MSESYAAMFHCDEGDDPNWTDFSVGVAGSSGLNANPPNSETLKAEGGECEGGVSVKIEEDDVQPQEGVSQEGECPVKDEGESLRDVVNFKEVVGTYKIFVSSLPSTATNEHLREMFAPYGTVLDCEVFQHKNYAFVHMDSVASGNEAVKDLDGVEFDGSSIRVQRSTSFPVQSTNSSQEVGTFKLFISQLKDGVTKEEVKEILEPYGRIVDIEIYRSSSAFVHMEEESAGRLIIKKLNNQVVPGSDRRLGISESKNPEGPNVPTITIHVKNFGAHITAEKMRSLFQSYGLVLRCTITDQHVDLLRKAIVLFEQLGDVRSAINELNNFDLDGQKLSVKPVFDEPTLPTPPVKKQPPLLSTPTTGFVGQRGSVAASPTARGRGRGSPSFSGGMGRGVGNVPFSQQPTNMHNNRGGRGGSVASARGRGNFAPPVNRNFQLIPMPSKQEINQANRSRGNFSRGGRGTRGSRGGQSRGNYQNQGFDQDTYDFDEYYQDPKVALSREHLSEFQNPNQFAGGLSFEPPQKIAKVQPHNFQSATGQPQALMGIDFHSDALEDQFLPQKSAMQSYEQLHPQRQSQVQSVFPTNPNYFSSDQIAGSSTNNSNFDGNSSTSNSNVGVTAYPANYYAGVAGINLNAVPFDYNNLRRGRGRGGGAAGTGVGRGEGKQLQLQTEFPPGVNPADYPDLKPGSKVYINGRGKVMVRGARIKGRPRPGLGSKGASNRGGVALNNSGASTSNGGPSFSGGNQTPVGVAGPSTSYSKSYNQFGAKKKSREQVKEDNQEYTEWLQQKSWLYTPIQGIVKPASK